MDVTHRYRTGVKIYNGKIGLHLHIYELVKPHATDTNFLAAFLAVTNIQSCTVGQPGIILVLHRK